MGPRTLQSELAAYISVLERSAAVTNQAADRPAFQSHLAAAALMFAAIHRADVVRLKDLVADERVFYGRSYLSGDAGTEAESTFNQFARMVEVLD